MSTTTITPTPTESRAGRVRTILAALAFVAIAAGSFQPYYFRIWRQNGAALHTYLTELPYRKIPGLRRLLVEADRRTPPGARILFAMPRSMSKEGYDYAFGRAQYMLGGKDLIPIHKGSPSGADYLLCWTQCSPPAGFVVAWKSEDGVLARRGK